MGSCSNRSETREEKVGRYASEVSKASRTQSHWQDNYENFQSSTGAKIRGEMGVEKGNAFIEAIRNANK